MANNYQIKDGNGNLVTFISYDTGGGVELAQSCPHDGVNKMSKLFDLDTSGTTHEYNLGQSLRISASGGSIEAKGQQAMASSIPVVIASNQSAVPVSQAGSDWSVNVAQLNGNTPDTNSGTKSNGTLRVVIATDQPTLTNSLNVVLQTGANTVGAVNQAGTWTVATNADCSVAAGAAPGKALLVAGVYNSSLLSPISGQSVALQLDSSGRVIVAPLPAGTNTIGAINQAGSWNVGQSGTWNVTVNTALPAGTNTIGNVVPVPASSGGLSTYRVLWPNNVTGVNVKGSAGQVYGWYLYNNATSIRIVKLYNKATAPTTGTDTPSHTIVLPPNGGANVFTDLGFSFSSGIGIAVTTGIADSDTTAPAANDVIINLFYN
jgi:hypothetical protein